jgi:hypothetical protein
MEENVFIIKYKTMQEEKVRPHNLTEKEYQLLKAAFMGYEVPLPNRREKRAALRGTRKNNNRKKTKARVKYKGASIAIGITKQY